MDESLLQILSFRDSQQWPTKTVKKSGHLFQNQVQKSDLNRVNVSPKRCRLSTSPRGSNQSIQIPAFILLLTNRKETPPTNSRTSTFCSEMEKKMEVKIVSKQVIKPSTPELHRLKPYSLCLFDQITPKTYAPLILFYPLSDPKLKVHETLVNLKKSLAETLNLFYPFSGRIKNNLTIDDFDAGVPFYEAGVNCSMAEFLRGSDTQLLNLFLPVCPWGKRADGEEDEPMVVFQVSIFTCGGIALGTNLCHKISDAATLNLLFKSWCSIILGCYDEIERPNLEQGSSVFPARVALPENYTGLMERLWFQNGDYVTKLFLFSPRKITALRAKARSEKVSKPSRIETLTGFIWKHAMAASMKVSGFPKTSILVEAVNIRRRMKSDLSGESSGNLFWWATVASNPAETKTELHDLVSLKSDAVAAFDDEYLQSLKGEEGFEAVSDYFNQLEEMFAMEEPDIFAFTSWTSFFKNVDFGWGSPFWIGVMGKPSPSFRNLTVFTESKRRQGIEAWVTLKAPEMTALEKDSEFMAFASPNPALSNL